MRNLICLIIGHDKVKKSPSRYAVALPMVECKRCPAKFEPERQDIVEFVIKELASLGCSPSEIQATLREYKVEPTYQKKYRAEKTGKQD